MENLANLIKEFPKRGHTGMFDPEVAEDSWVFYLFVCAQQGGTGLQTKDDSLSCSNIWQLYFEDWNSERKLFGPTSFQEYSKIVETSRWSISLRRLFRRYLINQDIVKHYRMSGVQLLNGGLDNIDSYKEDPYRKKLNLLKNILHNRPERFLESEGGPVVDYHLMRLFLRYLDLPVSDEGFLRETANTFLKKIHSEYGLEHTAIDTTLWALSRNICQYEEPKCELCPVSSSCKSFGKTKKREPRTETFFY